MEIFDLTKKICEDLKRRGYKVATNQKHICNYPVFHWHGTGGAKPDILFWDDKYEDEIFNPDFIPKSISYIRVGFIETKTGNNLGDLMKATGQIT